MIQRLYITIKFIISFFKCNYFCIILFHSQTKLRFCVIIRYFIKFHKKHSRNNKNNNRYNTTNNHYFFLFRCSFLFFYLNI